LLRAVALISALYDTSIGVVLLVAAPAMAGWFGVAPPSPAVFGDTNALFLIAVGLGYLLPARDPERYRAYLWLMGPFLKGAGAIAFVVDHVARGSPPAFLLFAASDGAVAVVTWLALIVSRPRPTR
jgi:hypothetical protein